VTKCCCHDDDDGGGGSGGDGGVDDGVIVISATVFVCRSACFVGVGVVRVFSATMQGVKTCSTPCVHCYLVHSSIFLLGVITPLR
jgi:hypothetical protein